MALAAPVLSQLGWRQTERPQCVSSGISSIDLLIDGCPKGQITEVAGPASSGRTTFLYAALAQATRRGEYAAVIDTMNTFDPVSAARAGADLRRFVWVRCNGNPEHAMRAADLLLQSGGFGFLGLDLAGAQAAMLRRIPLSYWFRFRRAVEQSPAVFLVVSAEPQTKSCSSVLLQLDPGRPHFSGEAPFSVLSHIDYAAAARKPVRAQPAFFRASVIEVDPVPPPVELERVERVAAADAASEEALVPRPARSTTHAGDGPIRRRTVTLDKGSWHAHPSPFELRTVVEKPPVQRRKPDREVVIQQLVLAEQRPAV